MDDSGYSVVLDASSIRRRLMASRADGASSDASDAGVVGAPASLTGGVIGGVGGVEGEEEEIATTTPDEAEAGGRRAPSEERGYRMPMFLNGRLASVHRAPEEIGAAPLPTGAPARFARTTSQAARDWREKLLRERDDPVVRFVVIVASITQDNIEVLLRRDRDARPVESDPNAPQDGGGDGSSGGGGGGGDAGDRRTGRRVKFETKPDVKEEWEEDDEGDGREEEEEETRLQRRSRPSDRPRSPEPVDPRDAWTGLGGPRSTSGGTASRDDGEGASSTSAAQKRRLDAFLGRGGPSEAASRSSFDRAAKRRRETAFDLSRVHPMVLGALSFVLDNLRGKMKLPRDVKDVDLVLSDLTYAEVARMCGHQIQIESGNSPLVHQGKIREVTGYHMGSFSQAMNRLLARVQYDPRRGGFVERPRVPR